MKSRGNIRGNLGFLPFVHRAAAAGDLSPARHHRRAWHAKCTSRQNNRFPSFMAGRLLLAFLLILLIAITLFIAFSWRGEISPAETPARASFDTALISRGASLAAIGDCVSCHTAPGGKAYAGG
ncbi:MAG TPA: hypothetical protein VFI62_14160, partial [Burkholderiales bacterium]|nr:hypothetical protein [Burkholderiales bacterium]